MANPFDLESSEGRDNKDLYDNAFESLLSTAPWRFATRRARLEPSGLTPIDSYTYSYKIPNDGLFLWEIYNKNEISVNTTNFLTGTNYSYYSFPLVDGTKFLTSQAEILGDTISSNYGELSILYTIDKNFVLDDCTRNFVDILMLNLEEDFMKVKEISEDDIAQRVRTNEVTKKARRAQSGVENRKAYGKKMSDISQAMNRFFY